MAKVHGFRVYVAQAFPTREKDNEPLNVAGDSPVREELVELLERLHSRGTQRIEPRAPLNGEPPKAATSVTVGDPIIVSRDVVHVIVSIGNQGSHRTATHESERPQDLTSWSPEVDHIITFLFPTSIDDRFLVVAQTVHRRDPLRRLRSLLNRESMLKRDEAREAEEVARRDMRARHETPPSRGVHRKLHLVMHQAADNAYLDELLSEASAATATFKSSSGSDRGSRGPGVDRTLQIRLQGGAIQEVGRAVGRLWTQKQREGSTTSREEGVSQLSDLMYERDLLDAGEGERYDSAAISVRSESNETTTIAVDTLRDVFTYPVSDGGPPLYMHYERVKSRVDKIAQQEGLEIVCVDGREVEECLNAST